MYPVVIASRLGWPGKMRIPGESGHAGEAIEPEADVGGQLKFTHRNLNFAEIDGEMWILPLLLRGKPC